ncbi:MAG TPA: hypothetical protein VM032_18905 [Vicinamibacterales bacterium]|nr:hypothetical protein [Vicinamibacterales bacterium]
MLRKIGMFVLVAWSVAGAASAQVAMLTQVTGDVRVSGRDGSRGAVPFLKVNDGDTLTLAGNARVQMVYLSSGRQEVWTGNGPVEVGTAEGRSRTLTAQASQVPALILRQLEKTPAVGQHGKAGMVMLRSMDNLEAIDTLEKDYKDYRARAGADDITPEVFFLTGLLDLQDYDQARKVIEDLKVKQRAQPAYAPVVEHFERLLAEARAAAPK